MQKEKLQLFPSAGPLQFLDIDNSGQPTRTINGNQHVVITANRFLKLTRAIPTAKIIPMQIAKIISLQPFAFSRCEKAHHNCLLPEYRGSSWTLQPHFSRENGSGITIPEGTIRMYSHHRTFKISRPNTRRDSYRSLHSCQKMCHPLRHFVVYRAPIRIRQEANDGDKQIRDYWSS